MIEPYASTHDYLLDYFALLAVRLHKQVMLTRWLRGPQQNDAFLGLFLSEEEINALLQQLHGTSTPTACDLTTLEENEARLVEHISARLEAREQPLRPLQLAALFELPPVALEVLLMLLALEVDNRFARVFAYLHDDVERRWLTPGLAIQLLPAASPTDPAVRGLFLPASPLLEHRLIHCHRAEQSPLPLLERPIRLDERIAEYLLDHDPIDPTLYPWVTLETESASLEVTSPDAALAVQLAHVVALWQLPNGPPLFIWGRSGSGKGAALRWLAQRLARPLLTLDAAHLNSSSRPKEVLVLALREAKLRQAILHIRNAEMLDAAGMAMLLAATEQPIVLSAEREVHFHAQARSPLLIHCTLPDHEARRVLWQQRLNVHTHLDSALPDELAGRFLLNGGQITRAATMAQQQAWLRTGPMAAPTRGDLFDGCRQQSNPTLTRLATKVVTPHGWNDLVLPPAQLQLLRAVESQVRHTHLVYGQWGFDHKLALGKGLNVLFSGQPGTGKTMAAGILAQSLGLDLYKIDLSGVVSKYIGETEKNLSQIFEEAATANVVLFFDEADALFGKRSEVKDAHDRYANIEISYLLQKMEEHEGITLLATNFSQNVDEAFTRRMHFWIDFPFPAVADRARIWRGLFPATAPCAGDIDFDFMARSFELAGGNIKNCVLAAAFLAAEEGAQIGMSHLIHGVAREYGKLGRPIQKSQFADYFVLARNGSRK